MRLKIVSYNILFGHDARVFDSLANIHNESKGTRTFVALQEVRNKTTRHAIVSRILRKFPLYQYETLISPKPSLFDLGLMTLSQSHLIDSTPVLLPKLPKRPLNPQTYFLRRMPQHAALITRYRIGTKIIRITNVHLDVMGGIRHKRKQLQHIRDYLVLKDADCDIICGDFNTIGPIKIFKRRVQAQIKAIGKVLGPNYERAPITTWTCDVTDIMSPVFPGYRIIYKTFKRAKIEFRQQLDWIFVRGGTIQSTRVRHDLSGSDHYPVEAIIQI